MKRNLHENQSRPTAGCLSVPLFNQKRRNRIPFTSNPSENEFCPNNEFPTVENFAASLYTGNSGYCEGNSSSSTTFAGKKSPWNSQAYTNSRPIASSVGRGLAPLPHPRKTANIEPEMGQQRTAAWQGTSAQTNTKQSSFHNSGKNTQINSSSSRTFQNQMSNPSAYRQPSPSPQSFQPHQAQRPNTTPPPAPAARGQWKFKAMVRSSQFKEDSFSEITSKNVTQAQKSEACQIKLETNNSLRILTAVIGGVKHWSQYKDRVPFLFEVFATLDSAVTVGSHGAKNFLLRDGKDSMHCVFFETDCSLPRLIRGQVHRCMGSYDRGQDLLTCMSVRPASASEQRNAQAAVRASDTEMRRLVRCLSEI